MPRAANLFSRCALSMALLMAPAWAGAADDFSAAEQALFLDNHLRTLQPPLTLHYAYRKTGTLEEPFTDSVDVMLTARSDRTCCAASTRFFSGARSMKQPDVEGAEGNPAIFYFLERDIREMERLTTGKPNYFRKRIRMAVYQSAAIRNVTLSYRGRPVPVREVTISPYLDDPNRARFEKFTNKQYVFMLSPDVPGGVFGIRTRIGGATADAPPLLAEEMFLDGVDPAPSPRQP
ncbi:MAG: hypothetical protein ABIQ60_02230 [Burkholderiaceae bacterium]